MAHFRPLFFAIIALISSVNFIIEDWSLLKSESCIEKSSRRLAFNGIIVLTPIVLTYTFRDRNSPTATSGGRFTSNSVAIVASLLAHETLSYSFCFLEVDILITRTLKVSMKLMEALHQTNLFEFIVKLMVIQAIVSFIVSSACWDRLVAEITDIVVGVQPFIEFLFSKPPPPVAPAAQAQDGQQGNQRNAQEAEHSTINLNITVR